MQGTMSRPGTGAMSKSRSHTVILHVLYFINHRTNCEKLIMFHVFPSKDRILFIYVCRHGDDVSRVQTGIPKLRKSCYTVVALKTCSIARLLLLFILFFAKSHDKLVRPGTGKIWTVEGDEKLDEKMEEGDLNRSSHLLICTLVIVSVFVSGTRNWCKKMEKCDLKGLPSSYFAPSIIVQDELFH